MPHPIAFSTHGPGFAEAYAARRTARSGRDVKHAYRNTPKRKFIAQTKIDRGCERCGVRDLPAAAYDFHHRVRSTKKFGLGGKLPAGLSWQGLRAEIAKCDVLCATCHRIVEADALQVSL